MDVNDKKDKWAEICSRKKNSVYLTKNGNFSSRKFKVNFVWKTNPFTRNPNIDYTTKKYVEI